MQTFETSPLFFPHVIAFEDINPVSEAPKMQFFETRTCFARKTFWSPAQEISWITIEHSIHLWVVDGRWVVGDECELKEEGGKKIIF